MHTILPVLLRQSLVPIEFIGVGLAMKASDNIDEDSKAAQIIRTMQFVIVIVVYRRRTLPLSKLNLSSPAIFYPLNPFQSLQYNATLSLGIIMAAVKEYVAP